MDIVDGLKMLRSEVGLTQTELAQKLNMSFTAVSRWENGRARPNRSTSYAIMNMAKENHVSAACLECLNKGLFFSRADDKEVVEEAKEVTRKMKLENREMLTSEQLRMTLDCINIGVVAFRAYADREGDLETFYCNRYQAELLGYKLEELLYSNKDKLAEHVYAEDAPKYVKRLQLVLAGEIPGEEFDEEIRVIHKDGTTRWMNTKFISMKEYSFGKEIFISNCDITERVEAQKKYKEELSYRSVFMENNLVFLHYNLTKDHLLQAAAQDQAIKEMLPGDSIDDLFEMVVELIPEGEEQERFQKIFNRKSILDNYVHGDVKNSDIHYNSFFNRFIELSYQLITNPQNGDVEILIYAKDAHNRKLTQQILQSVAQQIFEYISCVDVLTGEYYNYFKTDKQTRMAIDFPTYLCPEHKRMLNQFIFPQDIEKVLTNMQLANVKRKLEENDFYSFVIRIIERDGKLVYKRFSYTYMDDSHRIIIITRNDIQEIMVREEQKKKSLNYALVAEKQTNKVRKNYIRQISHDIRIPMTDIIGMTDLALANLEDEKQVRETLRVVKKSSEEMMYLIQNVLQMSRSRKSNAKRYHHNFNQSEEMDAIISSTKILANGKKQIFEYSQNIIQDACYGDYERLHEIISLLLDNSLQYTKKGGRISLSVQELKTVRKGMCLYQYRISDEGSGMDEEMKKHIFDPFYRGESAQILNADGTGLGLSIVKNLVELLDGRIDVESEVGKGSIFTVTIPFQVSRENEETHEDKSEPPKETYDLSAMRVLLVEDHELNRLLVTRILEKVGAIVSLAENGAQAYEKYMATAGTGYDVILMDIQMPVMDGYAAARRIRESQCANASEIPIVAMTANTFEEDVEKSMKSGMNAHIAKPLDAAELCETIYKLTSRLPHPL